MRWDTPKFLVVGLALTLVVTGVVGASTSDLSFGVFNPEWDGASQLRGGADEVGASPFVVTEMAEYDVVSPNQSISIVLSPDDAYTAADAAQLRAFVRAGGTLVVADDFGQHSNPLLQQLGVSTRIDGRLVRDDRSYYRSPNLPLATGVTESNLTSGVERLVLNHGTVLRPNGATVLVQTSPFAYLDRNGNATLDASETMGRYPVATAENVGDGRVVVVSDPSVFINAMSEQRGNRQFIRTLLSERTTMVLDYSHTGRIPSLVKATLEFERSPALQSALGLLLVGAVLLVSARLPAIRSQSRRPEEALPPASRERRRRELLRLHSDRIPDRRDTVATEVITAEMKEEDDD